MVAAQQLSESGVRVNALCPGLTETGMTKPTFDYAKDKGVEHKLGRLNPLRRAGQPEELAQVALFLASSQSSYVNGQAIAVDGGLSSSHLGDGRCQGRRRFSQTLAQRVPSIPVITTLRNGGRAGAGQVNCQTRTTRAVAKLPHRPRHDPRNGTIVGLPSLARSTDKPNMLTRAGRPSRNPPSVGYRCHVTGCCHQPKQQCPVLHQDDQVLPRPQSHTVSPFQPRSTEKTRQRQQVHHARRGESEAHEPFGGARVHAWRLAVMKYSNGPNEPTTRQKTAHGTNGRPLACASRRMKTKSKHMVITRSATTCQLAGSRV